MQGQGQAMEFLEFDNEKNHSPPAYISIAPDWGLKMNELFEPWHGCGTRTTRVKTFPPSFWVFQFENGMFFYPLIRKYQGHSHVRTGLSWYNTLSSYWSNCFNFFFLVPTSGGESQCCCLDLVGLFPVLILFFHVQGEC